MDKIFQHEAEYRGAAAIASLADNNILICGAGAIGSNLANILLRQGCTHLWVLDKDRVEQHNIGTQIYGRLDVGKLKADSLRDKLYEATDIEIGAITKTLDKSNCERFLRTRQLVIDAFDNSESRQLVQDACTKLAVPCLHVGLSADYGEVIWNERYRVPGNVAGDVCDYPLALNIIMLTVSIAAEVVISFLLESKRRSFTVTLRDLQVRSS